LGPGIGFLISILFSRWVNPAGKFELLTPGFIIFYL